MQTLPYNSVLWDWVRLSGIKGYPKRFVGPIVLPTIRPLLDHLQIFSSMFEMFGPRCEGMC